jgi:hypothetical protein
MLVSTEEEPDLEANPVLKLAKKFLPFTKEFHKEVQYHSKRQARLHAAAAGADSD